MPHVDIKYFPRDLSEEEKQIIADKICSVLKQHLHADDGSISVAMTEVPSGLWKETVYDREIAPKLDQLVKKPGYSY
ncbi:MAG: Tautomerase PptA [Oleibacter sp.]|nr:Tautomerase PptA [Thalassolituus sp.]